MDAVTLKLRVSALDKSEELILKKRTKETGNENKHFHNKSLMAFKVTVSALENRN